MTTTIQTGQHYRVGEWVVKVLRVDGAGVQIEWQHKGVTRQATWQASDFRREATYWS